MYLKLSESAPNIVDDFRFALNDETGCFPNVESTKSPTIIPSRHTCGDEIDEIDAQLPAEGQTNPTEQFQTGRTAFQLLTGFRVFRESLTISRYEAIIKFGSFESSNVSTS